MAELQEDRNREEKMPPVRNVIRENLIDIRPDLD
jgi:hypothetical protein